MYKQSLVSLIFYITTWGYLTFNILVAWMPSLDLPLLALRESWMVILVVFLFKTRRSVSLLLIFFISLVGFVPYFSGEFDIDIIGYFYGFRDIFLLILIVELLKLHDDFFPKKINVFNFLYIILSVSLLDVVLTNLLGFDIVQKILGVDNYYINKGVDINLSNGILGDRVGAPLFSPNLLCTLLGLVYFFDKRIFCGKLVFKFIALVVSIFTVSKVILVTVGFYFLGKRWLIPIIVSLSSIPIIYVIVNTVYLGLDDGSLKYHFASVIGHLNAFTMAMENNVLSITPDPLGSHSIAMRVMSGGTDVGAGIESSILTRLSELKVFYLLVVFYIFHSLIYIKNNLRRKFLVSFLVISLLTATSNQPVAFMPALFLLRLYSNE
ncbi:TPA: hypothetical protein ACMDO9_003480 [Vibrio cholerae]